MMSVVGALQPDLIAVVDDDESFRKAVQNVLRSAGLQVRTFASAEDFLRSGQLGQTACLISDIQMPGMNGLELLGKLVTEERRIPVVFITGYGNARLRNQAQQLGAVQVLDKPFDDEVLLETIREVMGA
jgi:FixJ family two-component response regulator